MNKQIRNEDIEGYAEQADDESADPVDNIKEPFDPNQISIIPQTLSIDNLIARIRNKEIDLHTAFQRRPNLWKPEVQSRLIESLMLKLPLPAFYFDATIDDKWLIVDGLQRLSTLKNFIIDECFLLTGLEILKTYDRKDFSFSKLPRSMQRRILEANITCYLISPGTPPKVKYNVFKRINTGALSLNEMEIRNALNQGKASDYLKEFTESDRFKKLIRLPSDRMEDRELVLRCITFMRTPYSKYESPLGSFLDRGMEDLHNISRTEFTIICDSICRSIELHTKIWASDRFSRSVIGSKNRYKLNSALFEAWVVVLSKLSKNEIDTIIKNEDKLKSEYKKLFSDKAFNDSVTTSTASIKAVTTRFQYIEKIINKYKS